jgi:carboxylesterase type B
MKTTLVNVLFISIFYYLINFIETKDEITVTIKSKQFNGLKKTIDGNEIDYFLGIPYAEPPIGKLRFKKPQPFNYENAINATKWPNVCFQAGNIENGLYTNTNMSEDCLYLNIWSPKIETELKPVMFWIHGGGLVFGSSSYDLYNPEILASRGDVVVVTFNYRLNAFGFLYTGSDDAPGNVGLWDQTLALQWVRDNIEYFGGDPQQVTIFGESAGSWSVSLHLLSPITRNLFKNAIMMSGAALSHMTGENPVTAKNNWLKVAKLADCGNGLEFTPNNMECLRNISAKKLVEVANKRELVTEIIGIMSQVIYGDEFLPQKPIEMLQKKDFKKNVRLLAGFTDDEGNWIMTNIDGTKFSIKNPVNLTKEQAFEELKNFSKRIKSDITVNGDDVAKLYLSRLPNNDFDLIRRTIGVALGDFYLSCPTKQFVKAIYEGDNQNNYVFQYYFSGKQKVDENLWCGKWQGACHGSDVAPTFGYILRNPKLYTGDEINLSKRMIDAFSYFAKHGSQLFYF